MLLEQLQLSPSLRLGLPSRLKVHFLRKLSLHLQHILHGFLIHELFRVLNGTCVICVQIGPAQLLCMVILIVVLKVLGGRQGIGLL